MTTSARSYLTAGIAVLGAGAIALTPVGPPAQNFALAEQRAAAMAVELAAAIDPITPWINTIEGAFDNIAGIVDAELSNPLPIIRQIIANQIVYISELWPNWGVILRSIVGNALQPFQLPFVVPLSCSDQESFGPCETVNSTVPVIPDSPLGDLTQQAVFALLPLVLGDQYDSLKPVLDFTTTPISGALLSLIGPVVGPVLSLVRSVRAIVGELGQADFLGAINELINIPANFTNALLNGGQFLDLTPLLSLAGVTLPAAIQNIGFTMGGLLSPGGVMFDGLAFAAALGPFPVNDPGLPVGPIGGLLAYNDYLASAIAVRPPTAQSAKRAGPAQAAAEPAPDAQDAPPAAQVTTEEVTAEEVTAEEVTAERADDTPAPQRERRTARGGRDAGGAGDGGAERPAAQAGAERRAG